MAKKKKAALKGGGTNTGTIPLPKGTKKAAKKTPTAKTGNLKVAGNNGKFAPDQPPIKGLEDVDERVKELDEECQKMLAARDKRVLLKQEIDDQKQNIAQLLHKHDLDCYIVAGNKFFLEPGVEAVKVAKVNLKG